MQIRCLTKDQWKIRKDSWAFLGGWGAGYVLRDLELGGSPRDSRGAGGTAHHESLTKPGPDPSGTMMLTSSCWEDRIGRGGKERRPSRQQQMLRKEALAG